MAANVLGLLKVRVVRGVNLAYRDTRGSDPYVILRMGSQKVKTGVKKKNVNPEWNEELTLSVTEPIQPMGLEVYDKDRFSRDDKMGEAEFDIHPLVEASKMNFACMRDETVVEIVKPSSQNCLVDESYITLKGGKLVQDVILRLRNVECGEVELILTWIKTSEGTSY
ncbi:GTPase activating protein 1-like [Canna indica]|uniref:GTPase activating protein 1-like n=1 Tax=Canna indica TaxID=4628 RepID=A0AAQ3QKM3_9LILI|nr:GTPase activating protein 1-like [Canna indica]